MTINKRTIFFHPKEGDPSYCDPYYINMLSGLVNSKVIEPCRSIRTECKYILNKYTRATQQTTEYVMGFFLL